MASGWWFWQLPLTRAINVALQVSDFFGQGRQLFFERVQVFFAECTILLKVRGTTTGYHHDKPYPEEIHETERWSTSRLPLVAAGVTGKGGIPEVPRTGIRGTSRCHRRRSSGAMFWR